MGVFWEGLIIIHITREGAEEGGGAYQVLEPPLSVEFDYIERERSLQVAPRLLSFSEKRRETVLQLTTRNFIANNTRSRE